MLPRPPHRPSPYAPLPWTPYFTRTLLLPHTTSTHLITHHIYLTPPSPTGPLFVTHHGAGSSGLSFALLAGHLRALLPNCGILSLDARGHGLTTVEPFPGVPFDSGLDTSLETLTADVPIILDLTQKALSWPTLPNIILIGHSLGGSVVTSVASQGLLGSALLGYAVLDIVEKTAIDALVAMAGFLASRPRSFPTLEKGVEWHVRSGTLRNAQSARVSVPALLRWEGEGEVREQGHDKKNGDGGGEGEGKEGLAKWLLKGDKDGKKGKWVWRTDLKETEPFWEGWFTGLNKRFLEARGGKLLLLAGTDRLDKDMMIGQMQGTFAPLFRLSFYFPLTLLFYPSLSSFPPFSHLPLF
jgi:protein phosphatase methylesterase 1